MSLFTKSPLKSLITSVGGILGMDKKSRVGVRKAEDRKRKLIIDKLEERVMLSVSAATWYDVIVNTSYSRYQSNETNGHAISVDHDGDFVTVWTRGEEVRIADPNSRYYQEGYYRDRYGAEITRGQYETEAQYMARLRRDAVDYYLTEYQTSINIRLIDLATGGYIDPSTGDVMIDYNIYARYMTDEVQRITIPTTAMADNGNPNTYGRLSLTFGGTCLQRISFTTVPISSYANNFGNVDIYTIDFSYGGVRSSFTFDENLDPGQNAILLQNQLQDLGREGGSELVNAKVTAITPNEFIVEFGTPGVTQELLQATIDSRDVISGFLPSVNIEMVRNAVTVDNIGIHHTDPALIAMEIKKQVELLQSNYGMGPIFFPSPTKTLATAQGPAYMPDIIRGPVPEISVTPVYGVTVNGVPVLAFDITYINSSGMQDQPLVIINGLTNNMRIDMMNVIDSETGKLVPNPLITAKTIKECSPEFQVNVDEGFDPMSGLPLCLNQYEPAVAMDADGDFIITWTSEADPTKMPGSVSDIYARRYIAQSWQDPTGKPVDFIQSVKPLGDPFLVNSFTVGPQCQSDVAMDMDGNFIIVWAQGSQQTSYFNGIFAQRYDSDGNAIANQFRVDTELTGEALFPVVAMNEDGYYAIAWDWATNASAAWATIGRLGIDPRLIGTIVGTIYYTLHDPDGVGIIPNPTPLTGGWCPSIDFTSGYTDTDGSYQSYFSLVYHAADIDNDAHIGNGSTGVRMMMYDIQGNVILDEYRVNSADADPNSDTMWGGAQRQAKVAMDADGDTVVVYYGYGPDVNENVVERPSLTADQLRRYMELFGQQINSEKNADLRRFFNPVADADYPADYFMTMLPPDPLYAYMVYLYGANGTVKARSSGDVDGMINGIMTYAQKNGANDEQLGRLYNALNSVFGKLRGEANGILFSMFDALPIYNGALGSIGGMDPLYSDSIANAKRDGSNEQYYVVLDNSQGMYWVEMGIRVRTSWGTVNVTFSPVYDNNRNLQIYETAAALEQALLAALPIGVNWARPNFDGPVEVRVISQAEITQRRDTYWEIGPLAGTDVVFEIQFQGDLHDQVILAAWNSGVIQINEIQRLYFPRTAPAGGGYFGISMGDNNTGNNAFGPVTQDMLDNPNLHLPEWNVLADQVAGALAGLGYPGAVVTVQISPTGQVYFEIEFAGQSSGADIPDVIGAYLGFNFDGENQIYDPALPIMNGMYGNLVRDGGTRDRVYFPVWDMIYGDPGTSQMYPDVGMTPDGDFTIVWTQFERYNDLSSANRNVYFRNFIESNDAAGPKITGIYTMGGVSIREGKQVSADGLASNQLVVTFDEEMMDSTKMRQDLPAYMLDDYWNKSVTNPANWAILLDGVEISGAILDIVFGLNQSTTLTDGVGQNKWEAVITLDPDVLGSNVLADGNYTIIAKSTMTDVAGNPLGRTGFEKDGSDYERNFEVLTPDSPEQPVNNPDDLSNPDIIINPGIVPGDLVSGELAHESSNNNTNWSPTAVSTNFEGDTVTVWTALAPDGKSIGVFARIDYLKWDNTNHTRTPIQEGSRVIQITFDSSKPVEFASVAVAGTGIDIYTTDGQTIGTTDFVVTWSQNDGTTARPDWNVYAQVFALNGEAKSEIFRVNDEISGQQRYSSVAMDPAGDFVITWQSNGNKNDDPDGYGVFAKRYNPAGRSVGGSGEVQVLNFSGSMTGTFRLELSDNVAMTPYRTDPITFTGNTYSMVAGIQSELQKLVAKAVADNPNTPLAGLQFRVVASSATQIIIYFEGEAAKQNVNQLVVDQSGLSYKGITVQTIVDGSPAEFMVNQTTRNNQQWASVSMDRKGNFVVTWTSFGQDGDAASESNVYARYFYSNQTIYGDSTEKGIVDLASVSDGNTSSEIGNFVLGTLDPQEYVSNEKSGVGVVYNWDLGGLGTGTLLTSGRHVLTAAHVVTVPGTNIACTDLEVYFRTAGGLLFPITVTEVIVHPGWMYDLDYDIAILVLAETMPSTIERYDINRESNELGKPFYFWGYGITGTGADGAYDYNYESLKRAGMNRFEAYATDIGFNGHTIIADFDSGSPVHDTLGNLLGIHDLGFGNQEISCAPGDSGGPAFIDTGISGNMVIGAICRGSLRTAMSGVDPEFGVVFDFTRTALYADWIDGIVMIDVGTDEFLVNQNETSVPDVNGVSTIINDNQKNTQKWSSVAMDADGDFVITWTTAGATGYLDSTKNDIAARRYNSNVTPASEVFAVNTTKDDNQQLSKVAIDADGDFIIVWESYQDRLNMLGVDTGQADNWGIFAQRYLATGKYDPATNKDGRLGGEFEINSTIEGNQRFPSVSMTDNGDFVVVWQGYGEKNGVKVNNSIFERWFFKTDDDTPPFIAAVFAEYTVIDPETGEETVYYAQIRDGNLIQGTVNKLLFIFDEQLMGQFDNERGSNSILSPSNWVITYGGRVIYNAIESIARYDADNVTDGYRSGSPDPNAIATADLAYLIDGFYPTGRSQKTAYWVTFNISALPTDDPEGLPSGGYGITIKDNVEDRFGNRLDGDGDGKPGGNYEIGFQVDDGTTGPGTEPTGPPAEEKVNTITAGNQTDPAIAIDADGNYVVVWTSEVLDANGVPTGGSVIRAQRYFANGTKNGSEFLVSDSPGLIHKNPAVAMTRDGHFVVTWTATAVDENQDGIIDYREANSDNVYAKMFDKNGQAYRNQDVLKAPVNTVTTGKQHLSSVTIDEFGSQFIVTWANDDSVTVDASLIENDRNGIWVQRYSISTGVVSREGKNVLVNTPDRYAQTSPDIACDGEGNFTVVWEGYSSDGSSYNIYARQYSANGTPSPKGTFTVNTFRSNIQTAPSISMNIQGDFVIAWASYRFVDAGREYEVVHRCYSANGTPLLSNEILTNTVTAYSQHDPSVSINRFVPVTSAYYFTYYISWTSYRQEQNIHANDGVYGKMYTYDPAKRTWTPGPEESINLYTRWNENKSACAVGPTGKRHVVWVGPDQASMAPGVVLSGAPNTDIYQVVEKTSAGVTGGSNFATQSWSTWGTPVNSWGYTPQVATTKTALVVGTGTVTTNSSVQTVTVDADTYNEFTFTVTKNGSVVTPVMMLNGKKINIENDLKSFTLDGSKIGTGFISAVFNGLGGETIKVEGNVVTIIGDGFRLDLKNCTDVIFNGTGDAVANLTISDENAVFSACGTNASLVTNKKTIAIFGCKSITATAAAQAKNAVAELTTSTGQDSLTADSSKTVLTGSGYSITVNSFAKVYATAISAETSAVLKNLGTPAALDVQGNSVIYRFIAATIYVNDFANVDIIATGNTVTGTVTTSALQDTVTTKAGEVTIHSESCGYTQKITGIPNLTIISGGNTTAVLTGSTATDTLIASPTEVKFSGQGFNMVLLGFSDVTVIGNGGSDTATLYDSVGDDTFIAGATSAILTGSYYDEELGAMRTYRLELRQFKEVSAISSFGNDTAELYDSAGNDVYTVLGNSASFAGPGFKNTAVGFTTVDAICVNGGTDTATITGIAGDNAFTLTPNAAKLEFTDKDGNQKTNNASGFAKITAHGNGGNDTLLAYDSAGDDTFLLSPGALDAKGPGFEYSASGIKTINLYRTQGGDDTLNVTDSAADETLVLRPNALAMISSTGYTVTADGFVSISVNASKGGNNTALLYGSSGNNTLTSEFLNMIENRTTMSGDGYFNEVRGFKNVRAYATGGGVNTATVYDSVYSDYYDYVNGTLTADVPSLGINRSFVDFDSLTLIKKGGSDTRTAAVKASDVIFEGSWE